MGRSDVKVLYVHQHFSLPLGCHPTRTFEFVRGLASVHQVCVACGLYVGGCVGTGRPFVRGKRLARANGFLVVQWRNKYANSLSFVRRIISFSAFVFHCLGLAFSVSVDIFICSSTPLSVLFPMVAAKFVYGSITIFEVRDRWPLLPLAMGLISARTAAAASRLERLGTHVSDMKVGLSPGVLSGILEMGAKQKMNFLISNFASERDRRRKIPHLKKKSGLNSQVYVIYLGTHGQANGINVLLEVARILMKFDSMINLLMFGDGGMKENVIRLASMYELKNVMFFDPFPQRRLGEILAHVDIAVHCLADVKEFGEGTSPNKVFEAMGAGLPVVTNSQGWLGRRLVEAGAGIAVPAQNAWAMAEALALLERDPSLRAQMGQAALALAEAEFARMRKSEQFCDAVEQCALRGNPSTLRNDHAFSRRNPDWRFSAH